MDTSTHTPATHTPATHDPTTTPVADPVLADLLRAELAYDPVARGGYINHLAMSLVAARRIGASDDQLRHLFDTQTDGDFLVARPHPAWLDDETERVAGQGVRAAVADRLPDLVDAPFAQFFHAVIRLDLAVAAHHPAQVANALVNWAQDTEPLAGTFDGGGTRRWAEVLDALRSAHATAPQATGDVRAVAAPAWFADALSSLRADDDLLDDLAATARAAHTDPHDFLTLHLITGVRSVRALTPLADAATARRFAWRTAQAVAALLVTNGAATDHDGATDHEAAATDAAVGAVPGWDQIHRAAIATGDPHVIKLVDACGLEERAGGDRRWRTVAARQVGLR